MVESKSERKFEDEKKLRERKRWNGKEETEKEKISSLEKRNRKKEFFERA